MRLTQLSTRYSQNILSKSWWKKERYQRHWLLICNYVPNTAQYEQIRKLLASHNENVSILSRKSNSGKGQYTRNRKCWWISTTVLLNHEFYPFPISYSPGIKCCPEIILPNPVWTTLSVKILWNLAGIPELLRAMACWGFKEGKWRRKGEGKPLTRKKGRGGGAGGSTLARKYKPYQHKFRHFGGLSWHCMFLSLFTVLQCSLYACLTNKVRDTS